jgi:DNA mismatch endonuclease (patch repair protein)
MADVVDRATRSRMMSGIRSRDTKPEIIIRKYLHAAGMRFRLSPSNLPGKPDIVLAKYRTIVLVHGCFWHQHAGCKFAAKPASNRQFWADKLGANVLRDRRVQRQLRKAGWNVIVVWECQTRSGKVQTLRDRIAKNATGPSIV